MVSAPSLRCIVHAPATCRLQKVKMNEKPRLRKLCVNCQTFDCIRNILRPCVIEVCCLGFSSPHNAKVHHRGTSYHIIFSFQTKRMKNATIVILIINSARRRLWSGLSCHLSLTPNHQENLGGREVNTKYSILDVSDPTEQ